MAAKLVKKGQMNKYLLHKIVYLCNWVTIP